MNYRIEALDYDLQGPEHRDLIRQANDLIPLIKLQLNPFGDIDKNIVLLLDKMTKFAEDADGQKLRVADALFIEHARWLLKAEWDKVKSEAKGVFFGGIVVRRATGENERAYLDRYRTFCQLAGNIDNKLDGAAQ